MEADRKTVYLFLNMRQKMEKRRSGTNADQEGRKTIEQFGGAVTVVLGQSGNGYIQPKILQHFVNHAHLPFSAVGDNEIGQFSSLFLQTAVTAVDDLTHRSVVVGAHHGLNVKMAILLTRRLSITEHHARGHRMGALQVGVIETFDMPRLFIEAQRFLDSIHQPLGIPFGILDFEVFQLFGAVDAGALLREFQQFEFFAALRNRKGNAVEQQRRRRQERNDHLPGQFASGDMFDDVLDGQRQHVPLIAPDTGREFHRRDAHDRTVADAHEIAIGHIVVRQQRKNIDIDDLRTDDHRLARIVVQRVDTLFIPLRQFEFQPGGSAFHLCFEVLAYGAQVAFQHRNDHIDELRILLPGLQPDTRSLAVAQVILEADRILTFGDQVRREIEFAGTQGNHLADEVEHAVLHHHRAVGAEILRAVARQDARGLHAGKMLLPHDDPRIGFIVFEQDVVTRLKAFDQ